MSDELSGIDMKDFNPDVLEGRTRIPAPKNDSRIAKWREWAERIRKETVSEIFTNREAFRAVARLLKSNPSIPGSDILSFSVGNYVRSQAVAVRRQTDVDSQSVTLGQLLKELESDNVRITRTWWIGQYDWGHQGRGDADFDQWAYLDPDEPHHSEPGDVLSPLRVKHDIQRLQDACVAIRIHVDKVIAHSDRKPPAVAPTFGELDRAIDVLGEVFSSYYNLLTCQALAHLYATPQFDRLAPFRQTWIS